MTRPNGLSWAIAASVAAHAVAGGLVLALPHGGRGEGEVRVVQVQLLAPPAATVPAAAVTPPRPPLPRPVVVPPRPKPKRKAKPKVKPKPRPRPQPVARPLVRPIPAPPEEAAPPTPPTPAAEVESAAGEETTATGAPTATPSAPITPPSGPVAHTGGVAGAGGVGPPGRGRATAIAALYRRLESHRRYPLQARRRGIEGTVGLRFRVAPDGGLAAAEVARTSGSRLLDRAALRTLDHCFPLNPTAARMLAGEPITVDLTFRLVGE